MVVKTIGSYDYQTDINLEGYLSRDAAEARCEYLNKNRPEYNQQYANELQERQSIIARELRTKYECSRYYQTQMYNDLMRNACEQIETELAEKYKGYTHNEDESEASYYVDQVDILDCTPTA